MCNNNNNANLVEDLGTYPWEIHKIQKRREESLVCVSFLDILFVSYYLDTMTLSSLSLRVNGRQWLSKNICYHEQRSQVTCTIFQTDIRQRERC